MRNSSHAIDRNVSRRIGSKMPSTSAISTLLSSQQVFTNEEATAQKIIFFCVSKRKQSTATKKRDKILLSSVHASQILYTVKRARHKVVTPCACFLRAAHREFYGKVLAFPLIDIGRTLTSVVRQFRDNMFASPRWFTQVETTSKLTRHNKLKQVETTRTLWPYTKRG